MFKIDYRIVENIEELRELNQHEFDKNYTDIVGFFSVNYGGHVEGYYHDKPLRDGETGHEMLTLWFELFLMVVDALSDSEYAAFREIDSLDTWHVFEKDADVIKVSIAKDYLKNTDYFITEQQERFSYIIKDIKIPYTEFVRETLSKSKMYLAEILKINNELGKTRIFSRLETKIQNWK